MSFWSTIAFAEIVHLVCIFKTFCDIELNYQLSKTLKEEKKKPVANLGQSRIAKKNIGVLVEKMNQKIKQLLKKWHLFCFVSIANVPMVCKVQICKKKKIETVICSF